MKNKKLIDKHYHIDNGGITVELNALDNGDGTYFIDGLSISNSFYGYTTNTMNLHSLVSKDNIDILEDLGKQLILASQKFKELNEETS